MPEETVDVLIVGAGAAGAAIAWSLAETRMNVLCLEQGDWMDPARYPSAGLDWELRRFGDFGLSPNGRGRPEDYPVDDRDSPIAISNFNAVGGGTILYAAHFPRFHPSDFRVRTLDGVADDWPLDYRTLEPWYDLNARMMGVAGLAGDPAYPPKQAPLPPVPLGRLGETLARGFNRLGWHWWPSDSAIATQPYEGRPACIHLGPCLAGCAQGAKGSTDVTYWPAALRRGARLRTRCRVREVTLDARGMADGVIYFDEHGVERRQRAELVVLACNGVGTPRLLLLSRSRLFPDGLANRSGLVGRRLMFHPYALVTGVFPERLEGYKGPMGCVIMSQHFYETDRSRGFVRGYTFEMLRGMGPISTALWGMGSGQVPWGERHHDAYEGLFDRSAGMVAICEDLPELENAVTLDAALVDSHGIPAPKVRYRLSENSERMLEHAVARAKQALEAAGALRSYADAPLRPAGWHLMGTARMGRDPERSVVNEWGRSHDVKNLFIVDGSVFVTSAGVNPTHTIQAIALHVAERIKQNLSNLFDEERRMSEAPQAPRLPPGQARALVAVLDALVPPSADGRLPGAGELGVLGRIEDAMRHAPELADAIRAGLAGLDALALERGREAEGFAGLAASEREALLHELAERQPGFLPGLLFHTFAAYYQHPRVLAGLGLEPRPPFPRGYALESGDLEGLLAPVRCRAPLYRSSGGDAD